MFDEECGTSTQYLDELIRSSAKDLRDGEVTYCFNKEQIKDIELALKSLNVEEPLFVKKEEDGIYCLSLDEKLFEMSYKRIKEELLIFKGITQIRKVHNAVTIKVDDNIDLGNMWMKIKETYGEYLQFNRIVNEEKNRSIRCIYMGKDGK